MSDQVLTLELTAIYNDSKKKFPDVRNAAETSLQELKAIAPSSQQQVAAQLAKKPSFLQPFILACASQNIKLVSSSIICIQRLVALQGLPSERLKDVLHALNQCVGLSFDVQLKVLQVLPALAQNYALHLKGDLLTAALQVCAALQAVQAQTISGVATATFQQLVFAVWDRIVIEDSAGATSDETALVEVVLDGESFKLRNAASDGYALFSHLTAAAQADHGSSAPLADLAPILALDTIWSSMHTYSAVFATHKELVQILRTSLAPFLIRVLSERQSFDITLRAMRLALLVLQHHLQALSQECEIILGLLTYSLEPDAAPYWKRVMSLEIFRSVYSTSDLAVQIYMSYDQQEVTKSIVKDNIAAFVRLSGEKPAAIGLGPQSTVTDRRSSFDTAAQEQHAVESAGGMVGAISSALAVTDVDLPGISVQRSVPRMACLDHLDKHDPPVLPETYSHGLVIDCLSNLSDAIAKTTLSSSASSERFSSDDKTVAQSGTHNAIAASEQNNPGKVAQRPERSHSQRSRSRSLIENPLNHASVTTLPKVKAVGDLIEECWPAILATTSTFLNATLDNDFYRILVRSFQRFTQVAGVLELSTARDAFLTTLSKAAVPASMSGAVQNAGPLSPGAGRSISSAIYRSPKALLSVDNIVSTIGAGDRRQSISDHQASQLLTSRNLLCLRALLNLAIAVGPLLGPTISIILQTQRQADVVLASMLNSANMSAELTAEANAVSAASKRLFEMSADYPNDAFVHVLEVVCRSVAISTEDEVTPPASPSSPTKGRPPQLRLKRLPSLYGSNMSPQMRDQDRVINLKKIRTIADLNMARFADLDANSSGWNLLSQTLINLATCADMSSSVRNLAAEIVCHAAVRLAQVVTKPSKQREHVHILGLTALEKVIVQLNSGINSTKSADHEVHGKALAAVRDILEACNNSLQTGWVVVLGSLETVFESGNHKMDDGGLPRSSPLISPILGRLAFETTQLICSDFLSLLPKDSIITLLDILYRFARQDADLNMSLTTLTLFLDVSTFLTNSNMTAALRTICTENDVTAVESVLHAISRQPSSTACQWLIMLHRLGELVVDDRPEIRHSACQTSVRILSIQAGSYAVPTWRLILHCLLLRMLHTNLQQARQEKEQDKLALRYTTCKTLLDNMASLLSGCVRKCQSDGETFKADWQALLEISRLYLWMKSHVVAAAVFGTLTRILGALATTTESTKLAATDTLVLWRDSLDIIIIEDHTSGEEQNALLAYCDCALEIHDILAEQTTIEQIEGICTNCYRCVVQCHKAPYGGDLKSLTPLQKSVMKLLTSLRQDKAGAPQMISRTASSLVTASLENAHSKRPSKFSLVAISKEAIGFLVRLVQDNVSSFDPTAPANGAELVNVLNALNMQISNKYRWKVGRQFPDVWQLATTAALDILERIIVFESVPTRGPNTSVNRDIWPTIVDTSNAIVDADLSNLELPELFEHVVMVEEDEAFDCAALSRLQNTLGLGVGTICSMDGLGSKYMASYCRRSLIHVEDDGTTVLGDPSRALCDLYRIRMGQVYDHEASRREDVAYCCFEELVRLASANSRTYGQTDDGSESHLLHDIGDDLAAENRTKLAQTTLPYLLLRFACPIKAYLADQPLRGSSPTPISKVEELLWTLEQMQHLRCRPAIVDLDQQSFFGAEGAQGVWERIRVCLGAERTNVVHIDVLQPLLVQLVQVAGHRSHGDEGVFRAVSAVLEMASRVQQT